MVASRSGWFAGSVAPALAALAMGVTPGCSTARPAIKDPSVDARLAQWASAGKDLELSMTNRMVDRLKHECDEFAAGRRAAPPEINILSLSGGGDRGAFGAGFLNGWASVAEKRFQRPDFDVVTGVSTGSLIAPFAFVGTAKSYETIETLYRNPKKDWIKRRDLLFFLPDSESFMTIDGLKKSLAEAVNLDLVRSIADQATTGRILAVSATNEDLGVATIFDLGQEAGAATRSGDVDPILKKLQASSAVPAVFPPVEIDGMLYGDGGVTANVLIRLDLQSPRGFLAVWRQRFPDTPVPFVRYWIIFNNQIQTPPETVQPTWVDMAGRALEISLRSATLSEIKVVAAEIDDLNNSGVGRGELWLTAIPNDWRPSVPGTFRKENMDRLADIGRRMGADPASWISMTRDTKPD